MRPVSVFANASAECERLRQALQSRWRPAVRAMMVLLSLHGLSPAQVAALVEYDPGTVRRWIGRFNAAGVPVCRTGPAAAGPGWAEAGCPADRRAS